MSSKQELAYQLILNRILDGYYGGGSRIIVDSIAKELNCSVIPVRESIKRLESEGLVEHIPNVGVSVARIDEETYTNALSSLAVLDGYAHAISAPFIDEVSINNLKNVVTRMEEAVLNKGDLFEFKDLNREFHEIIYQKCPNKHLLELIHTTRNKINIVRKNVFTFIPRRAQEAIQDHKEIIRLIESKASTEEIEKFAREHKLNSLNAFKDSIDNITGKKLNI